MLEKLWQSKKQMDPMVQLIIPNWFWLGILIPFWGLTTFYVVDRIYYRKHDLITYMLDKGINYLKSLETSKKQNLDNVMLDDK